MANVYIETLRGLLSFLRDNDAPMTYRAIVEKSLLLAEISAPCDSKTDDQKVTYLVLDECGYDGALEFDTMDEVEAYLREALEEYSSKSARFTIYEVAGKQNVTATLKTSLVLE